MTQQPASDPGHHALTNLISYCADFLEAAGRHSLGSLHFRHSAARRGYLDVARLTCDEQLLFPDAGSIVIDPRRTTEASLPDVGISFADSGSLSEEPESLSGVEIGAFELMRRIHGMVRSNPYEFECIYGSLFLEGTTPGGAEVFLPLLSTPVSIRYEEEASQFHIEASQDYANLNLHAISRLMPLYYKRIEERLLEHARLPIPVDIDRLLEVLHLLQGDGEFVKLPRELVVAPSFVQIIEYQTIREEPSPPGQYRISRASGLAVMRRGSVFVQQDLRAMREMDPGRLEQSLLGHFLHSPASSSAKQPQTSPSVMGEGEVLFPFSTNQQQIDIAYAIEQNDLVVVEGPPGTGKSQTLANLAVHLAARGRRVLLVSEQPKAVEVATRNYISTLESPFLPMTVHRRDGEILRDLRDQLTQLKRLAAELSPERARERAAEAESKVERLRGRLMELHHEFHDAAEFDAAPWGATGLTPGELAAEYAKFRQHDIHPHSEPVGWDEQEGLVEQLLTACRRLGSAEREPAAENANGNLLDGPLRRWRTTARIWLSVPSRDAADRQKKIRAAVRAAALRSELETALRAAPRSTAAISEEAGELEIEGRSSAGEAVKACFTAEILERYSNPERRNALDALLEAIGNRTDTVDLRQSAQQIDPLLSVFPCWVASVQDAARLFPLSPGLFDVILIDEASQCSIPSAMPLLFRAKKAIVVGDAKQLRSIQGGLVEHYRNQALIDWHRLAESFSNPACFDARSNSMFDLASAFKDQQITLTEHFRCHPRIIAFSNSRFYENRLSILTHGLGRELGSPTVLQFVDDAVEGNQTNPTEAEAVVAELRRMLDDPRYDGLDFAACSPFRRQAELIWDMMCDEFSDSEMRERNLVSTTPDGLQGDERDVVVHSFVYAPNSEPAMLSITQDPAGQQRVNVALTRARRQACYFISVRPHEFPPGLLKDFLSQVEGQQANLLDTEPRSGSLLHHRLAETLQCMGLFVHPFVRVGDYVVDFVVQDSVGRVAAVEADDWLRRPRQDLGGRGLRSIVDTDLRRAGWRVFRVHAIDFFLSPDHALEALISYFRTSPEPRASMEAHGRQWSAAEPGRELDAGRESDYPAQKTFVETR